MLNICVNSMKCTFLYPLNADDKYDTVNSRYLKVELHLKLLISPGKFSGFEHNCNIESFDFAFITFLPSTEIIIEYWLYLLFSVIFNMELC